MSSHVSNGNLLVDNGATGVIQTGSHGVYEENLSKFKGIDNVPFMKRQHFLVFIFLSRIFKNI